MLSRKSVSVSNSTEKRMNGFSWFFLGKVGHEARSTLEHFRDLAVNPLNAGSILIFSGSVFVSNIMGKRLNGFSSNFHDMSGTTQEVTIYIVLRLNRLFLGLQFRHGDMSVNYDMRNNLEHFGDYAFNFLNTGSIFLFSGSVFVTNIMGIQINGYSWNFDDMDTRSIWLACFTLD